MFSLLVANILKFFVNKTQLHKSFNKLKILWSLKTSVILTFIAKFCKEKKEHRWMDLRTNEDDVHVNRD